MRLGTMAALLAAAMFMSLFLLAACGPGDSGSSSDRSSRERTDRDTSSRIDADIPGDLAELIPDGADMAVIFDVSDWLDGDVPQSLQSEFEDWADYLLEGNIDLDDVDMLIVVDDGLLLAEGDFDFDDIRDNLEDRGYDESTYSGFETWDEWVALIEDEQYVILGFVPGVVEDLLQSLDQGRGLLANERDSDLAQLLDEVGAGSMTLMVNDCDARFRGCNALGTTFSSWDEDAGELDARLAYVFRDSESAEDAQPDLEDIFLDDDDIIDISRIRLRDNIVVLDVKAVDDQLNFANFVRNGPVAGSGRSRPARPAATATPSGQAGRYGDGIDDAGSIDPGDEVDGRIARDEGDFFEFNARRGDVYIIQTEADFDTYIELLDEDGGLIASDDDGGEDNASRLLWEAPYSGNYYVLVRGYSGGDTGRYTLSLTFLDPDEHGDSIRNATRINPGDAEDGWIEYDGRHYFEFNARRGRTYVMETTADFDTYIELLDEDGDLIASDDDGGEDSASRLIWEARTSGRYYVVVRGYSGGVTGTYRLSLSETR